jgi:orotidine-5'-phosphate decarboxylase
MIGKRLCTILCFFHQIGFAHPVFDRLDKRIEQTNSVVCVGLDPDIALIPDTIRLSCTTDEEALYAFLTEIIDVTAPHTCAYKLQKAFYDQLPQGHDLMRKTIEYIRTHYPDIVTLIDCKLCDTDTTMQVYTHLMFDLLQADIVVINPYVGDSVIAPFIADPKKVGLVLIKSGNPGSEVVQDLMLANGNTLWEELLHLTVQRWDVNKNLMVLIAPTSDTTDYIALRKFIPQDMPILMPGICVQNGNPNIMRQLLNEQKRGVLVNFARAILYPYKPSNMQWKKAVLRKIIMLKDMLNAIRL